MAPGHVDLSVLKRCSKCGETKPVTEFTKDGRRKDGYQGKCRDCSRAYWDEWRSNNSGKNAAYTADWRARNPDLVKAKYAKYRAENRERCNAATRKWRTENKDRMKTLNAKWHSENRDRVRSKVQRRRAIRKGRTEIIAEVIEPQKVFQRDGWRCGRCGKKVNKRLKYPDPKSASLDHIVPLSAGGDHTYVNVQLAHLRCNLEKKNTGAGDQLAMLGGFENNARPKGV